MKHQEVLSMGPVTGIKNKGMIPENPPTLPVKDLLGQPDIRFSPIADDMTGRIRLWIVRKESFSDYLSDRHRSGEQKAQVLLEDIRLLETALDAFHHLPEEGRLVFFLHPESMAHVDFSESLRTTLKNKKVSSRRILLGIHEEDLDTLTDMSSSALFIHTERGTGLCICGGAGNGLSLLRLAGLQPDLFLLESSAFQQHVSGQDHAALMVGLLSDACRRIQCVLGVIHIHKIKDRRYFKELGFSLMQGAAIAPESSLPSLHHIEENGGGSSREWSVFPGSQGSGVGYLASPGITALVSDTVEEISRILKNRSPTDSICLLKEKRPVGLLMRYHLDRHLSSPYGNALFLKKSVARIMDTEPVIRDAGTPLDEVARAAMSRSAERLYDDILITENGLYKGTVSIRSLLDVMARIQVETARGANPLTGLPGNTSIEKNMAEYRQNQVRMSLIYADLDHFKAYNDCFGFEAGDRMLMFTSRLIRESASICCGKNTFIGHVGGDDFVIFTHPAEAESFAKDLTEKFERETQVLYPDGIRNQGFFQGKSRDGTVCPFPMVSISLGIVDCQFHPGMDSSQLSLRVAQIKGYAKSRKGNSWVRDRRQISAPGESILDKGVV
ncbi:GGDEF domain-containing protein [Desulfobotulus sp. H1]|uniref:diguanylate cyclase n=1 Tax=Desulfobotulus pelophilus TaxID=2823377 RepID=A0ABT3N7U8_9BACT|nr:GGDEF domain-containing protein [Desulfobotulus pelophilus]MCW7753525.1 GGDEF domain-containing protein [Desulfobotulus pelophilus]